MIAVHGPGIGGRICKISRLTDLTFELRAIDDSVCRLIQTRVGPKDRKGGIEPLS
jgi:hypothetical protein